MCGSGCGLLYSPNVPLEDVTCPCGKGYWDVFDERFVDGDQIRRGSASRKEYEAKVRRTLSAERYTAKIRHQWIIHFLDCEIKTRMDKEAKREGRPSGNTMVLALTELYEMSQGDYKSRGTSHSLDRSSASQPLRIQDEQPVSIERPSISRTLTEPGAQRPSDPTVPATSYGSAVGTLKSGHDQASISGSPLSTYRTSRVDMPVRQRLSSLDEKNSMQTPSTRALGERKSSVSSGTAKARSQKMFLSGEGIAVDILKHHLGKGRFGRDATMEPYVKDGKAGYLIEAEVSKIPTAAEITQLKDESRRFEIETRTRLQGDRRCEWVPTTDSRLSGQALSSQTMEPISKASSRDFDEVLVERNSQRGRPTEESSVRGKYPLITSRQRTTAYKDSAEGDDDDDFRTSSRERSTTTGVANTQRRVLPRSSDNSNDDERLFVTRRPAQR